MGNSRRYLLCTYVLPSHRYAMLTVLVPPEPPTIRVESRSGPGGLRYVGGASPAGGEYRTVEGSEVGLVCESRGGKPASEVSGARFPGAHRSMALFSVKKKVPWKQCRRRWPLKKKNKCTLLNLNNLPTPENTNCYCTYVRRDAHTDSKRSSQLLELGLALVSIPVLSWLPCY